MSMLKQEKIEIQDVGNIEIFYLKKIWYYFRQQQIPSNEIETIEWKYINGVFNSLGLGTEPTIQFLMGENPSFEAFEDWILTKRQISKRNVQQFNQSVLNENKSEDSIDYSIFTEEELSHWKKQGYIILRNAISKEACQDTVELIYKTIDASPLNPETWYKKHPLKKGIMIQLFDALILDQNRHSERIRKAYEQLWNTKKLVTSMDRVSFNPPETAFHQFQGPNLHWDVSLKRPIPFGLQGLLYLTDTKKNQGAFTVVPGFHTKIDEWLRGLEERENPRELIQSSSFKKYPIEANAGDLIIWHQCLPHGSSPNTSNEPRIVQYINYQPLNLIQQDEWI